jgi:hypothetical protein
LRQSRAGTSGITKNGRKSAVVISWLEFDCLTASQLPLVEFHLNNPSSTDGLGLDLTHDSSLPTPEIDFNETDFL